jgi:hypothetical protein
MAHRVISLRYMKFTFSLTIFPIFTKSHPTFAALDSFTTSFPAVFQCSASSPPASFQQHPAPASVLLTMSSTCPAASSDSSAASNYFPALIQLSSSGSKSIPCWISAGKVCQASLPSTFIDFCPEKAAIPCSANLASAEAAADRTSRY